MAEVYEHHLSIKKNKLLPFKVGKGAKKNSGYSNWHDSPEIIFVREGEVSLRSGTVTVNLSKGDIAVINCGAVHCLFGNGERDYRFLIIDEEFCLENGIDASKFDFDLKISDPRLFDLLESISDKTDRPQSERGELFNAILRRDVLNVMIMICSSHSKERAIDRQYDSVSEKYVKNTIAYINENYRDEITLEELSDLCGITKYHLAREFKRYTGQTVFTYVNLLRCKRADAAIREGKSIADAAYECGFGSLAYFSRTYKRLMGVSPSTAKRG